MRQENSDHGAKARFKFLSAFFLKRLHEIAERLYAPLLKEDAVRMDEVEDEVQRYYAQKKSGLQDVYSYYYGGNYYSGDIDFNLHNLEIPMVFANKFRMANNVIMQIGLGAFVSYTFQTKASGDGISESVSPNAFGGGPLVDFGWEIKRHWLVNVTGRFGWIESNDYFDDIAFMEWSLSFGYKF